MFVGTMCNSEDTSKTMSLHVRRVNVSFMECQEKKTGLLLSSNAHKQTGRWQPSNRKLPHCDWYNGLSSMRDNKSFCKCVCGGRGGMKSFESSKFDS